MGRFGFLSFLFLFSLYPQKSKFEEFMKNLKRRRKKSYSFVNSFLRVFKKNRAIFVYSIHKRITLSPNYSPMNHNLYLPPFYFPSLSVPSQFRNKRNKFPFPNTPSPVSGGLEERWNLSKIKRKQ